MHIQKRVFIISLKSDFIPVSCCFVHLTWFSLIFFYCLEFCVYPRYNVVALVVQCGLAPHLAGGFVAFVER